ncbi:nuclease-related domain-containing protein [Kingella negevensis]|uniref:nuclease-related domain-containing protein n=1 Tax=Kingella negevensis TaxID=1522312 RepID=UPI00069364D9|nr:nuclease-related domain-containing protein [Kingella negevensis]
MHLIGMILLGFWKIFTFTWWWIPIILFFVWLKSPKTKGLFGEKMVQARAAVKLDSEKYHAFHNLIVLVNGQTTQIDHVYVSVYGIFVIETKYHKGWIYGSLKDENWICRYSNNCEYPFKNPTRQNYGHIKALETLLRQPEKVFKNVVVFTYRNCQIKKKLPDNICLAKNFIEYVQQFQQEILTAAQIHQICETLSQPEFIGTKERTAAHVQSLKTANNAA